VSPPRRDLGQRRQGESPSGQARMGEDRVRPRAAFPREIQDVDIDLAGTVAERPRAPHAALDFLQSREQRRG